MKKFVIIATAIILSACGLSDDCIKKSGAQQVKQSLTDPFESIYINAGITLVLKQAPEHSVSIYAGSNFIDDIQFSVIDNVLRLNDNSGCNWVRDYGTATVYVTAPNIIELYSNTQHPIKSDGILSYPMLRLYAMDFFGGVGSGDFTMEIDNSQLVIASNNVASFYIKGRTDQMLLNFYDGIGRFEGEEFAAKTIKVFHRGSNDMIVHPVDSLMGDIYSTGHIRSKTHPVHVDVRRHYSGKLFFD